MSLSSRLLLANAPHASIQGHPVVDYPVDDAAFYRFSPGARQPFEAMPNKSTLVSIFVAFLTVLLASTAQAAGGGDDHDPVREALWQGFNLALIVSVLFYFGRGPISEFFATRRNTIKTELTDAADLLTQAEQRNAELQRRLVDLSSEVEGIRESSTRRAEEEAERILADARGTAERIRRDAQAAVDQELRRAQTELRTEASDLALELAATKLTQNVGESDRDRLIDEFILRVEPGASEGANS